jgi:hypothetical protein
MGMENFMLILPTIAIGVIALINIFLYKNRTLQFRLCILAIVLELLLMFLYYREIATYLDGTISLTALLHVGVLIFLVLSARGIRYDDKIIKESSRLR